MYVAVINTWTRAVKTLKQHKMTDKADHVATKTKT